MPAAHVNTMRDEEVGFSKPNLDGWPFFSSQYLRARTSVGETYSSSQSDESMARELDKSAGKGMFLTVGCKEPVYTFNHV